MKAPFLLQHPRARALREYRPSKGPALLGLAILLIVGIRIGLPQAAHSQAEAARSSLQQAAARLEKSPSPEAITPGERRSAAQRQADHFARLPEELPEGARVTTALPLRLMLLLDGEGRAGAKALSGHADRIAEARSLAAYHGEVLTALKPVLEYNASVDTARFRDASEDAAVRMDRAEAGLKKARASLASLSYSDPRRTAAAGEIAKLQHALDLLRRTGDTAAWKKSVEQAQEAILENRTAFWQEEKARVVRGLMEADAALVALEQELKPAR